MNQQRQDFLKGFYIASSLNQDDLFSKTLMAATSLVANFKNESSKLSKQEKLFRAEAILQRKRSDHEIHLKKESRDMKLQKNKLSNKRSDSFGSTSIQKMKNLKEKKVDSPLKTQKSSIQVLLAYNK